MAPLTYLNFDLTFESGTDGYAVRATSPGAGEVRTAFVFPFSELELENFLLRLGQRTSGTRRADSPEMELSKQFGGRLFSALFNDDVRAALRSSVGESERQGAGLRIRLRFGNAPELADIPWEYLYDGGANRFLTLSRETPLIRYLELSRPVEPLQVQAPLRILVMISDPTDYERLDVEAEWQRLNEALAELRGRGLVEIVRLDKATLLELQRALRGNAFHIFHYIGHGVYDAGADDGFLVLEDEKGRGRKVGGQYVGTLLADHRSLRLALLNSCEGGRASRTDPFAGAAQSLIQQGLPAVVAMQFAISDDAAAIFAQEFYMALAAGYPVDAALAEGRRAIFATKTSAEWGIPVLFMRAADGRIFDVQTPARPPITPPQVANVSAAGSQVAAPPTAPLRSKQPETAPPTGKQPDTERSTSPLIPPAHETEETSSASPVQAGANVAQSKRVSPTGNTPNDLRMVKIIGVVILGTLFILSLLYYLIPAEPVAGATLVIEGITFVFVPAGEFTMGSKDPDADEKPVHNVYVDGFWIMQTEVTNAQWQTFMQEGGYSTQRYWTADGWQLRTANSITAPSNWTDTNFNGQNYPVVGVSWYESVAYANWLAEKSGRTIRLPSEAEWEKAARGVDGRRYPWGDSWDWSRVNYCDSNCKFDWRDRERNDGYPYTAPVGSYAAGASPYGSLDMAGNVSEWVGDWYADFYEGAGQRNPTGPNSGMSRVVRGGSWSYYALNVRSAFRYVDSPGNRVDSVGLRLVAPRSLILELFLALNSEKD